MIKSLRHQYGFVPYSLNIFSVYLPYLLVNVHLNHGLQRNHGYAVLFRDTKLVPSISVHFIRVICGGSIRDEKWYIPADFSTFNHERLRNFKSQIHGGATRLPCGIWQRTVLFRLEDHYNGRYRMAVVRMVGHRVGC